MIQNQLVRNEYNILKNIFLKMRDDYSKVGMKRSLTTRVSKFYLVLLDRPTSILCSIIRL